MPAIHEDDDNLVDDENGYEDGDEEKTARREGREGREGRGALGGPWVARDSSFSIIGRAVSTPNRTRPQV